MSSPRWGARKGSSTERRPAVARIGADGETGAVSDPQEVKCAMESVTALVRAAVAAYEDVKSFEATVRVRAERATVEAHVRAMKPDCLTIAYRTYEDPFATFDQEVTGSAEFSPEELVGIELISDGRQTWVIDRVGEIALRKRGWVVYEPLPGLRALGELGFMPTLVRDFLMRDEGETVVAGRPARGVGLKPKTGHRSLLLREVAFPMRKASVAFDNETLFPLRITASPSDASPLIYWLGPSASITVEYEGVRLNQVSEERFSYEPQEGIRVFREEILTGEELMTRLPFEIGLAALLDAGGYRLYGGRGLLTSADSGDRAYAKLVLTRRAGEEETAGERVVTLRIGNYLSRNMSRRRAFLAENGEGVELHGLDGRIVDRGARVKERLSGGVNRALVEIGWERDGIYGFMAGEGIESEDLRVLVATLLGAADESGLTEAE